MAENNDNALPPLKMYDWQEVDADWLGQQNSLLANDCGTGKTLVAVESAKKYAQGPVLVVAPRLTKLWWAETIKRQQAGFVGICGPGGSAIPWPAIGARKKERPLLWVIVHPTAVRMSYKDIMRVNWDTIIVDEAHRFKNRKALQTKALWKIPCRHKIMLTATPYGKSPADMWALLHYLYPKEYTRYWKFFTRYVDYYQPPGQRFRKIQGAQNREELARRIAPYYRRRGIEKLNLPPFTYTDIPVVLSKRQEQLYMKLVRDAYAELVGQEVVLSNALARFIRLQQCSLDPSLLAEDLPDFPLDEVPAKIEWLQEWLDDHPNEPVIITSRFRRFVEKWLIGLAPEATIVGGMSEGAVDKAIKSFNNADKRGKRPILVGSLDAIKEGLNLQKASTMIITDGTWSSTAEYQLSRRIWRPGQERPCQVVHLVGRLQERKRWSVDKLVREAITQKFDDAKLMDEFIGRLQRRRI